jgi:hypothetical protein
MMKYFRAALIAATLSLLATGSAYPQCSGQFPANTFCGVTTAGLPGPKPITPALISMLGGTVLGNPTGATAAGVDTRAPVLGLNGTAQGSLGLRGSTSGTVTIQPGAAAAGTYNFNLPTTAGTSGFALLSGGGGAAAQSYAILGLAAGGTNAALTASNGGLVYSDASGMAILAGTPVAARIPLSGALAAPSWSTASYPPTAAQGSILAAGTADIISATANPTLGIAGTLSGTITFAGLTSGGAVLRPQDVAGTPQLFLPNTSGTLAGNATSPLVLSATTGTLTCPTCVTSSGGGAITGTAPITVSAAGVVALTNPLALNFGGSNANLTASNGGIIYSTSTAMAVLAGTSTAGQLLQSSNLAAPSWTTSSYPSAAAQGSVLASLTANTITATRAPVLGLNGTATGSLGFAGSSTGTMTMQPGAAAGTGTLTVPNTAGTLVSNATSPLAIGAATGTITCTTCVTSSGGGAITGTAPVAVSAAGAVSITGVANQVLAGAGPAFTATPTLGTNGGTGGQLTLNGSTSGSAVVSVAAAAGTTTFRLPVGNGTSGQVLSTDGAGLTSWIASGGTGTVTNVQIIGAGLTVNSGTCTITTTGVCTLTTTAATAADQETATSTTVAVVPNIQQRHPSATKASAKVGVSAGATLGQAYNISSVGYTTTGVSTVNFTTAFSAATAYLCVGSADSPQVVFGYSRTSASQITVTTRNIVGGADIDQGYSVICDGDQ